MEGVAATKALLDRFDEVSAKFGDPDADMDALMAEQAELQEQIDAVQGWELQRTLDIAMDALRCPPGIRTWPRSRAASAAGSRCAACCCSSPTCCSWTSRPITWMPNRSPGSSASSRITPAPWSRSPTTATSSTMSPAGSSSSTAATAFPGRATTARGSSRSRSALPRRRGRRSRASRRSRVSWNGSGRARARVRPRARRASPRMRIC